VDEGEIAPGLFGRREVLRVIDEVMDRGGSAVAIGAPGAGKSSLMKAGARLAARRGRRLLSVTPTQFERGLPFAGLAELIGQVPAGADGGLPAPQRRALAVALQRAEPDGRGVDPLAVSLAVRALLERLSEAEPLALLVDDLQWLDPATEGSLGFAIRCMSVPPDRLSVLVATRPDPEVGAGLIRCLARPQHELVLRPLEDWAIGQLLRERLGARWTPPMSAGVARASSGNPFLALEIARAAQAAGHDPVLPVPPSLVELLGERVLRLPPQAREVLLLVSATGRLSMAQLRRMVEPELLVSALEAAADADVAVVDPASVVAFTHPLLASALYDAAAPADRRRAHRALAQSLDDPVERARHRSKSIAVPDEEVAAELDQAAEISRGRGAQQLVGALLERAALATPTDGDTAAGLDRWLRAVDGYVDAGDVVAAQAALDKGSSLAGAAHQRAEVLVRRAQLAVDAPVTRALAEQAFPLTPDGSETRAKLLRIMANCHLQEGHGRLAFEFAEMAVTAAAAVGHLELHLAALGLRRSVEQLWGVGQAGETTREVDRLVESGFGSSPLRTPSREWATEWAFIHAFFASWDDQEAEKHVRDGIALAIDAGRYGDLSGLYICLIMVLIRSSRVREARSALDEADRSGAWTGFGVQKYLARILVQEYSGDLDGARELAKDAAASSGSHGLTYWRVGFLAQLGFIETSARNWQAALETLREVAAIIARTKIADLEQMLWAVDYADAALHVGALDEAESAIAALRRQGTAGRPEATVAADRCQALLTAVRGDTGAAVSELRRIVDQPAAECPFEAARSRLALGQVYRRAGFKAGALESLATAAAAFEELGVPCWADRARHEAGRVWPHPSASTLTATEHRVATLVGAGHSNQETAAELFMSVKTVEANLTRIYRKLSVRSRTELANHMNKFDDLNG